MRDFFSSLTLPVIAGSLALASPLLARTQQSGVPSLGIVVRSSQAYIGNAGAADGATVYSGDYLHTDDNGALLVRVGALSLELESNSEAHIYTAPYGAVVELNRGSVIYTTPGTAQNLVIVASDVRFTPDVTMPDLGRVTIDNPCEVTAYSQHGQANAKSGKESHLIEEGKAYHVRADNKISYREFLSPDADDYHRHHEHVPCAAALDNFSNKLPLGAMGGHFAIAAATMIGAGTGIAVWKVLESPDKP
jgi:hypothetical protein